MRPAVPFVLFVLALAAGCGDDGKDDADGQPTTSAEATTTTDEPTTTTEAATTTTCPPPPSPVPELARVDLDGDGTDEVWRSVGSGASTEIVELRQVDGCVELVVELEGLPAQFAVGGTVTHLDTLRCQEDGSVVATAVTSEDGLTYAGTATTYELRDGELVVAAEEPVTVGPEELGDGSLQTGFTCAAGG